VEETKWIICSNSVVWRIVDREAVILGADGNTYFSLNETATRMWEMLDKGHSGNDIVNTVSREYGLTKSKIEKDYRAFIAALKKEKLIKNGPRVAKKY